MTTPSPGAGLQENRTLDQITLVSRVLEGFAPAPKVIVHDFTISGEAEVSESATLSYSIPLPLGLTYAQEQAAKAVPLYDGTVWKLTLQTYRVARLTESARASQAAEHARETAGLKAEAGRLREDLAARTRDFQDALALNAGLRARIAELEADGPDGPTRPAPA